MRSGRRHSKPPLEAQISLHLNPIQSKGQTFLAWNTSSGFGSLFPVYLPRVWLHTPTCCTHTVQIPVSQPLILPFKCAFHGSNLGCLLGCVTLSTTFISSESHLWDRDNYPPPILPHMAIWRETMEGKCFRNCRDFPGDPVAKTSNALCPMQVFFQNTFNADSPRWIPDRGTRSHMSKLRVPTCCD